jgi:hypothetical protein
MCHSGMVPIPTTVDLRLSPDLYIKILAEAMRANRSPREQVEHILWEHFNPVVPQPAKLAPVHPWCLNSIEYL